MPGVVRQGPNLAAIAVCRDCAGGVARRVRVILHGSRGCGGWDEQSDLNLIVVHGAAGDSGKPGGAVERARERHYWDSLDEQSNLESGAGVVTPGHYNAARRRTLNHPMARAARHGLIFPREQGTEGRYRHDGDTCNEWDVVTMERLEMAAEYGRSAGRSGESWNEMGGSWGASGADGRQERPHTAVALGGGAAFHTGRGLPDALNGRDGPADQRTRRGLEP